MGLSFFFSHGAAGCLPGGPCGGGCAYMSKANPFSCVLLHPSIACVLYRLLQFEGRVCLSR